MHGCSSHQSGSSSAASQGHEITKDNYESASQARGVVDVVTEDADEHNLFGVMQPGR
jgi:hypothetical protein